MSGAGLIRADALHIPLADETVDLIVTSPPYFALRSYQDDDGHYDGQIGSEATPGGFLEALWAVTAECARVLKPSGSCFINLGDKYAGSGGHNNSGISNHGMGKSTLQGNGKPHLARRAALKAQIQATRRSAPDRYNQNSDGIPAKSLMGLPWRYAIGCIDQLGLILRAEIVWSKPNGLPESVADRVRRSHEQWFHLTKEGRYYSAVDEIREAQGEHSWNGERQQLRREPKEGESATLNNDGRNHTYLGQNPLGKLPGSVWTIATEPLQVPDHIGVDHFAAFPQEWPRRLILGWSPPGICVECGEGRWPCVDVEYERRQNDRPGSRTDRNPDNNRNDGEAPFGSSALRHTTIIGYSCACPTPTAPTRPAVVLDPFAGTGTVPMVARALGRYGIGIDLSAAYLRLARWRIYESGHDLKSIERTHGSAAAASVERQRMYSRAGQESLF